MATNAPLPTAEAKVQIKDFGSDTWRDSLDFDPVEIPVESADTTDVFNSGVINLVNAVMEAEIDADGFSGAMPSYDYQIVWSASGLPVLGMCPVCDESFPVSEGVTGEEYDEGNSVWCGGCDPQDGDDDCPAGLFEH